MEFGLPTPTLKLLKTGLKSGGLGSCCKGLNICKIYIFYIFTKGEAMGQKILLNLPEKDLKKIDTLVKAGEYATKTELIRFAVKQLLYSQERIKTLEEIAAKLQQQTKTKKQVEKEIEEAKEETRKIISKMRR